MSGTQKLQKICEMNMQMNGLDGEDLVTAGVQA